MNFGVDRNVCAPPRAFENQSELIDHNVRNDIIFEMTPLFLMHE